MSGPVTASRNPAESCSARALGLHIGLLVALAGAIAGAALLDYRIVQEYDWLRVDGLVAGIAAGIGIVFCLGGAMYYTNTLLCGIGGRRPAWYFRLLLAAQCRVLMLAQLAATALVLAAIMVILFNMNVPGPDYAMLFPGGYTPPAAP